MEEDIPKSPPPPKHDKQRRKSPRRSLPNSAVAATDAAISADEQHSTHVADDEQEDEDADEADSSTERAEISVRSDKKSLMATASGLTNTPTDSNKRTPVPIHPAKKLVQEPNFSVEGEMLKGLPRNGQHIFAHLAHNQSDSEQSLEHDSFGQDKSLLRHIQSHAVQSWTDEDQGNQSEEEELDRLKLKLEENDMEELLAWGTDEIQLDGMPELENENASHWFTSPFVQFELDSSDSGTDDEDGSENNSIDTAEEEEQMMVLNGMCDSDDEGETTDDVDDTDHASLVRFGIELQDKGLQHVQLQTINSDQIRTNELRRQAHNPAVQDQGPVLGTFPTAGSSTPALVIEGTIKIASPYTVRKIKRVKPATPLNKGRRDSMASSSVSATSASAVSLEDQDTPLVDFPSIAEEEALDEDVFMDLDLEDLLESTVMHAGIDILMPDSDPETTDCDKTPRHSMSSLNRWTKIPIGAYRSARSSRALPNVTFLPALRRGTGGFGEAPVYLPIANLLSKKDSVNLRMSNRKRRITRQELIGLSPILCPLRSEKMPSTIKSRRQKRAEKRQVKHSQSIVTVPATEDQSATLSHGQKTPGDIVDSEVPLLELPGASQTVPEPAPSNLLPVPTLPSAGLPPLNSPLFSAVRHAQEQPAFLHI